MNYSNMFYIFVALIIIIVLLFCSIGISCKNKEYFDNVNQYWKNKRFWKCNNIGGLVANDPVHVPLVQAAYANSVPIENFENPYWKNERYWENNNIGGLVANDPVHVPLEQVQNTMGKKKQIENFLGFLSKNPAAINITDNRQIKPDNMLPKDVRPLHDNSIKKIMPDLPKKDDTEKLKDELHKALMNMKDMNHQIQVKKDNEHAVIESSKKVDTNVNLIPQKEMPKPLEKLPSFKFFGNEKCGDGYKYSGAQFTIDGAQSNCGNSSEGREAKAIGLIKNGKIVSVILQDKGNGYSQKPSITVKGGGGKNAELNPIVNEKGEINEIIIVNGGEGFYETPDIYIDPPHISSACFLCYK